MTTGGQGTILTTSNPTAIAAWVESGAHWESLEKRAVLNLVSNYLRLKAFREQAAKKDELVGSSMIGRRFYRN